MKRKNKMNTCKEIGEDKYNKRRENKKKQHEGKMR